MFRRLSLNSSCTEKPNYTHLHLSKYIIQRKSDYYRLLHNVTLAQEWEPWLLYMLKGIEETCLWTTDKIRAIRELMR